MPKSTRSTYEGSLMESARTVLFTPAEYQKALDHVDKFLNETFASKEKREKLKSTLSRHSVEIPDSKETFRVPQTVKTIQDLIHTEEKSPKVRYDKITSLLRTKQDSRDKNQGFYDLALQHLYDGLIGNPYNSLSTKKVGAASPAAPADENKDAPAAPRSPSPKR